MSEDTERCRVAAGTLSEMLDEAPEYVDPINAGAIGFLLSQDADPASDDAALARRLLEFAVGNAPDDRLASSWRLALGMIHRWLAIDGDELSWEPAFRWFDAARATSANSTDPLIADVHLDATDGLGELHVARLDAVRGTATVDDAALLDEFDATLAALADLVATTDQPGARALLHGMTAQVLANRYGATGSVDDLDRAAAVLTDALPALTAFDGVTDNLMLFGAVRREQYALRQDKPLIQEAVDAVTAAIEHVPPDDPDQPLRHLELAELLALRDNLGDVLTFEPDDRDRIIDHLTTAVTADLSAEDYRWYGELLLDRGHKTDAVDDLREAVRWLGRSVETDAELNEWEIWDALSDAHTNLFDLTRDVTHADLLIDCAGRVLEYPLPDHALVQKQHYGRLHGVFAVPLRTDLVTVLRERPVTEWLRAARLAVDPPHGVESDPEVTGLLALVVAIG